MEMLKKFFPYSFKSTNVKELLIVLVIYIIADAVCGAVIGLFGKIPVVGLLCGIVGTVVGLYFLVAIFLAILHFVGVFKEKE